MNLSHHIKSRIVKISIPAESRPDLYWRFTGYVLCDGLILTCLHGFTADERRFDDQRSIKITCQSNIIDETVSFSGNQFSEMLTSDGGEDGKPVLYASEDFDVALLACSNVKAVFHPIRFIRGDQWKSGGFPAFNVAGEANGFELFGGTHLGSSNEGCSLNITVTEPKLKSDAYWGDASGSPVFVDGDLVGVLEKYRPEAEGSFVIGYLQRLWDRNDGFQATIKQHAPAEFSYPQIKVKNLLEADKHKSLAEALCGLSSGIKPDGLAVHLLSLDEKPLIDLFQQLGSEYRKPAKPLLVFLLSAIFEDPFIDAGNPDKQPYHDVNMAYPASCEFLMAAHDQRQPEFLENDLSSPRYSVATVEGGIKPSFKENFASDLLNGKANLSAVAERILHDHPAIPGFSYGDEDKIEQAQGILESQNESYYWPVTSAEKQNTEFSALSRIFPELRILNRQIDPRKAGQEAVLIREVNKFLKD